MQKTGVKKLASSLTVMLLVASAGASHAASLNQNITLGGTVAPVPVTCAFTTSERTRTINSVATAGKISTGRFPIEVTCTAPSFPLMLTASSAWTPIMIGSEAAGAVLKTAFGTNFYDNPQPLTTDTTGFVAGPAVGVEIGGAAINSNLDATKHIGAIVGTLQLILTY